MDEIPQINQGFLEFSRNLAVILIIAFVIAGCVVVVRILFKLTREFLRDPVTNSRDLIEFLKKVQDGSKREKSESQTLETGYTELLSDEEREAQWSRERQQVLVGAGAVVLAGIGLIILSYLSSLIGG